jgi:hypothetical protein
MYKKAFETKKQFEDYIRDLRFGYSEEIPEELKHSTDKDRKYKVRKAWFSAVYAIIYHGACEAGFLSDKVKKLGEEFIRYQEFKDFPNQERTNRYDIAMANLVLDAALRELTEKTETKYLFRRASTS